MFERSGWLNFPVDVFPNSFLNGAGGGSTSGVTVSTLNCGWVTLGVETCSSLAVVVSARERLRHCLFVGGEHSSVLMMPADAAIAATPSQYTPLEPKLLRYTKIIPPPSPPAPPSSARLKNMFIYTFFNWAKPPAIFLTVLDRTVSPVNQASSLARTAGPKSKKDQYKVQIFFSLYATSSRPGVTSSE